MITNVTKGFLQSLIVKDDTILQLYQPSTTFFLPPVQGWVSSKPNIINIDWTKDTIGSYTVPYNTIGDYGIHLNFEPYSKAQVSTLIEFTTAYILSGAVQLATVSCTLHSSTIIECKIDYSGSSWYNSVIQFSLT